MDEPILKVSLKDYKKSIDELRASLLNLDSASKEYQATAEEIKTKQDKLNEVMAVGKKDVDAVAGSYNALSQEMSNLKKEWKNMEIGTDAWKEMAVRINDLNDKLKGADAQVGVFSRNVGDYANAFGQAFDKAAGEIGKVNGPLGETFKTIKLLIPVIKSANGTAVKGLKGVKAALVSTGIGALIVAVGLLVTHWEDLMKLFRGTKGDVDALKKSNEELNKTFDSQNFNLEQQTKIMEAQGAEADELIKTKIQLIKTQIKEAQSQLEETRAAYKAIAAHTWLGRVLRGEQGDYKELQGLIEEQESALDAMNQKLTGLETDLAAYYERKKNEAKKSFEAERKEADKLLQSLEENNKTELQKLTEKYQRELALLKKHHKSTKALTEQYLKEMAEIDGKAIRKQLDNERSMFEAENVGVKRDSSYYSKEVNSLIQTRKKIYDIANKAAVEEADGKKTEEEIYRAFGFGSKAEFIKYGREIEADIVAAKKNLQDAINSERIAGVNSGAKFTGTLDELKQRLAVAKETLKIINETKPSEEESEDSIKKRSLEQFETVIALEEEIAEFKTAGVQFNEVWRELRDGVNPYGKGLEADAYKAAAALTNYEDVMQEYIDNMRVYTEDGTEIFHSYFEGIEKGSEEWKQAVLQKLTYFPEDARSTYLELLANVRDSEKAILDERVDNWFSMAGSIADVFGSIGELYEQDIENQKKKLVEEGKTEEEANKILEDRFESMKAFQIAEAVINTIAGAVGAFMGITKDTGGWGIAAAIAEAAAVTAAGVAQIQRIASTTIGSTSVDGSSMSASVTPKLADYSPERTSNLTTASDTDNLANALAKQPVYVKVSDIDRAQKKVQVREGEARF